MWILEIILHLSVALACTNGYCTDKSGTCVASTPLSWCAECSWTGWLDADGACVARLAPPLGTCERNTDCMMATGACGESVYGQRCAECNLRGFLDASGQCECYHDTWVPSTGCTSPFDSPPVVVELAQKVDSVTCVAFQDATRGCFQNNSMPVNTVPYGEPSPFVPLRCCADFFGPPIGQLVEDGLSVWQECNTYGAFDPNDPQSGINFRTCSGHGDWDRAKYECVCDWEWSANSIGWDFMNHKEAFSCGECFGFMGPRPPVGGPLESVNQLYCSVLFAPDENGELAECSGHGTFVDGACVCDYDAANGFWALLEIQELFVRTYGNGTREIVEVNAKTCATCASVAAGVDCTELIGQLEPGVTPGASPAPVAGDASSQCELCQIYPASEIRNGAAIAAVSIIPPTRCCTIVTGSIIGGSIVVEDGSCGDSEIERHFYGAFACGKIENCVFYSWIAAREGTEFSFYGEKQGTKFVMSAAGGSGSVCETTAAPHPSPTVYPTQFPGSVVR